MGRRHVSLVHRRDNADHGSTGDDAADAGSLDVDRVYDLSDLLNAGFNVDNLFDRDPRPSPQSNTGMASTSNSMTSLAVFIAQASASSSNRWAAGFGCR
jgi:hypothetical protein